MLVAHTRGDLNPESKLAAENVAVLASAWQNRTPNWYSLAGCTAVLVFSSRRNAIMARFPAARPRGGDHIHHNGAILVHTRKALGRKAAPRSNQTEEGP